MGSPKRFCVAARAETISLVWPSRSALNVGAKGSTSAEVYPDARHCFCSELPRKTLNLVLEPVPFS